MRFRTEIDRRPSAIRIDHVTPLLMLGSCFTDEVGRRLEADGFEVLRNPLGPLYNPCSILRCVELGRSCYTADYLQTGPRGFHALDFASRYSGDDAVSVADAVNTDLYEIRTFLDKKPLVIITLGSAFVFTHKESGNIVGNCHKLPADAFTRRLLSVDEASAAIDALTAILEKEGCRGVVITVSPIRHLADGLHGNTLSKATLQLAAEASIKRTALPAEYFPSFEIMNDDLRDYRFYAADMKHPSETAVDYIYEVFSETHFNKATLAAAADARHKHLASLHRPIL